MFGIKLGSGREKIVAIADIGSASAAIALLKISDGVPAVALAAERVLLPAEERAKEATIAGVAQKLQEAGAHVLASYSAHKHSRPVEEVYAIVRAPWTRSKTAYAGAQYQKEETVSAETVAELAKQALAQESELDKKEFLEASVVRVELNGYPSASPKGKRAHEIVVHALVSTCDVEMRAKASAALEQTFPHLQPIFRSSTRVAVSVLGELETSTKDYLIADVGSQGTHLIAVEEGVAINHELVQEGMYSMLKKIAPLGLPEETLNLMRMLARDECSDSACETLAASVAKAEPEFVRAFGEAMARMALGNRLPERLVLVAHPDISAWLAKFFSRIDFTQFTKTAQPFAVSALAPADLSRFISQGTPQLDIGLALGAALVNIENSRG